MNQSTSQQIIKTKFTEEQIAEQKQFMRDLKNGNADIAFTGTFEEGIQFLKDTGNFVDAFTHA